MIGKHLRLNMVECDICGVAPAGTEQGPTKDRTEDLPRTEKRALYEALPHQLYGAKLHPIICMCSWHIDHSNYSPRAPAEPA